MMLPSRLPAFEIPTGLMATGLRGLRGLGHGLASVDVSALAEAQFEGKLTPSYLPTQYYTPSYSSVPVALPQWYYPTQAFAQQIATLLGGTVQSGPPYDDTNAIDGVLPNAYSVLVDGQTVMPGQLLPPGVVLSYPDECAVESAFAGEIPGGVMSSACQSGATGMTPTQLAVSKGATPPVTPGGVSTIVGYTPPVTSAPVVTTPKPTTAGPTPQPATITASDTCTTVVSKIAALQQAGYSNITIWDSVPDALLLCPSVQALNPNDSIYTVQAPASQPGAVSGGASQTTAPSAPAAPSGSSSSSSSTTDNASLYVGLAIAAVVMLALFK